MMQYRLKTIQLATIVLLSLNCVGTDFITSPVLVVPPRITITSATQAILVGRSATLEAVYYDSLDTRQSATFQWTSSNTNIASISVAGVVDGHQAGQVDIQATAHGVTSDLARLSVVTNAATQVATVIIDPDSTRLTVNESLLFSAEILALDGTPVTTAALTWQSANSSVATINSSGLVNGLSPGTTVITATADGIVSRPATVTVTQVQTSRSGQFTKRPGVNYTVNGTATLVVDPSNNNRLILNFGSDFQVSNGPGIDVFLSMTNQVTSTSINLGDVKRLTGAQSYEVPPGGQLDTFDWVIIHCVPFNVTFGYAQFQ
jgi:hypothetical protein